MACHTDYVNQYVKYCKLYYVCSDDDDGDEEAGPVDDYDDEDDEEDEEEEDESESGDVGLSYLMKDDIQVM